MAAPHVAGEVALLISASPSLRGQVDQLETIIEQSAVPFSSTACSSSGVPNNLYGWGRIDVLAAANIHALLLSKNTAQAEIAPGQAITYTLSLTHAHLQDPTTGVVISDTLPAGTSFVSASPPYALLGDVVRWDFASLDAGETVQVELVVGTALTSTGMIINESYSARSQDVAPVFGDPVETTLVPYTLELLKTAPARITPGSPLTYTLSATNSHPFAVQHALLLTDSLPLHTSFISASLPYTLTGDILAWQLSSLAAGDTWTVELVVGTPLTYTGELVNDHYSLQSQEVGPLQGSPVVTQLYMLGLDKTVSSDAIAPGLPLTYTLTVTNQNPLSLTTGLVLTDSLPLGTQFVSATGSYTLVDGVLTWQLGDLAPAQSIQVELVVSVSEDFRGWLVNENYAVWSQQVTQPVIGTPVSTWVAYRYFFQLPLVAKT